MIFVNIKKPNKVKKPDLLYMITPFLISPKGGNVVSLLPPCHTHKLKKLNIVKQGERKVKSRV
jgi:hypothetical protein